MADLEKVIDKIRKLLALSTSDNPHEAALASSRASALLLKHNLDIAEIEKREGQASEEYTDIHFWDDGRKQDFHWKHMLLGVVAGHNFCRVLSNTKLRVLFLLGKPTNIEVSKYLYDYLTKEVVRLTDIGWKREGRGTYAPNRYGLMTEVISSEWKRDFAEAAVSAINSTLYWQRQADLKDAGTMALVTTSAAELDDAVARRYPEAGKAKERKQNSNARQKNGDAVRAGYWAGSAIPILAGVEAPEKATTSLLT